MAKRLRLDSIADFVSLSEALTGFDELDLRGTGLVDAYYDEVRDLVGGRILGRLLLTWVEIREAAGGAKKLEAELERRILASDLLGPVARNLITLWYLGNWAQLPREWRETYGAHARDRTRVVSAQAFREGLVWRAIDAHPPTAKSPGFGTWAEPPPGAEVLPEKRGARRASARSSAPKRASGGAARKR